MPPSTAIHCPVMFRAASLARNAVSWPMSSGVCSRPSGTPRLTTSRKTPRASRAAKSGVSSLIASARPSHARVHRKPGQIALTRISCGAYSRARLLVSEMTPALAAAYAGSLGEATSPAIEAMLTMAPPPHAFSAASPAAVVTNVVLRFCERYSSHCAPDMAPLPRLPRAARGTLGSLAPRPTPALFTRMSSLPNRSTTDRTAFAVSASMATSHATASPGTASAAAVFSASAPSRSRTATCAPCEASTRAMPAPMPRAPPVTMAVFPVSINLSFGLAIRIRRHARLFNDADAGAAPVKSLRPRHRLFHAARHLPAEMPRHMRVARAGDDDATDAAQPFEWMRGQDRVDRMEGEAMPVGIDVRGVACELVLEAGVDLVRIARVGEHAVPDVGIRRMMDAVPRVGGGGGHDDRATRLAGGVDHAAEITESHRNQREDRVHRRPDRIGARVGHPIDEDVDRLGCRGPARWEALRLDVEGRASRLVHAPGEDARGVKGIGEQCVDLEDAASETRLEMATHLVQHGVHAIALQRHRHPVGIVGHADRAPRREADADRLPAARESADVIRVHVHGEVGVGDEPAHLDGIAALGRHTEVGDLLTIFCV